MQKMPVIFIGHGSPMNAIEDNAYTANWRKMAAEIPQPKAIISVSAHWFTNGTKLNDDEKPKTIYDMYGFPRKLYEIAYDSPGEPQLAHSAQRLISKHSVIDNSWGIDHGTWSVLVHMYPKRDIPVIQLSIDAAASPQAHYKIGQELKSLRREGVLLFGTGNIVHNLRMIDWNLENKGFDWAYSFDEYIKDNIENRNHENIMQYASFGNAAKLAVPTPDHFNPILYILGATDDGDNVKVYNYGCMMGSLSMTSYLFGV